MERRNKNEIKKAAKEAEDEVDQHFDAKKDRILDELNNEHQQQINAALKSGNAADRKDKIK